MADTLTRAQRSAVMGKVRGKGTKPEVAVRRLVSGLGVRYRLHAGGLPGSPDLAMAGRKRAIFVHGCFWHRHPGCASTRLPKSRLGFWKPKLLGNRRRDLRKQKELRGLGWRYLVVWECELKRSSNVVRRLKRFLAP